MDPNPTQSLEPKLPKQVQARVDALATPPNPETLPANPALIDGHDAAYWHARFKVTDGLIRKNREEHEARIEVLQDEIKALNGRLEKAAPAALDLKAFYTPEQIEKYGEEYLRDQLVAQQKMLREAVQGAVEPLKKQHDSERKSRSDEAQAEFLRKLEAVVPNWREVDGDPRWHLWLQQIDENGVERQEVLNLLSGRRNADGVARMFKQFLTAQGAVDAGKPQPLPVGGGAGVAGSGAAPSDPVITKAFVKDFYKRKALGKISDKEAAPVEAKIAAAYEAGIVR